MYSLSVCLRAQRGQTYSFTRAASRAVISNNTFTKLRLTDVQYSPNVAYMLVSIRRLDDKGYSAKFGKGKCVLEGPDGEKIREVLRTTQKAYKVEHEEGMANVAEETLTLDRLHRRMGHASIQVI